MVKKLEPHSGITADYLNLLEGGTALVAISIHRPDLRYAQVWVNGVEFRVPPNIPVVVPTAVVDLLQNMPDITVKLIQQQQQPPDEPASAHEHSPRRGRRGAKNLAPESSPAEEA